jgi:CRP-like cAMP-binding protein
MLQSNHEMVLFGGLSEATKQLVVRTFEPFNCPAGTVIFEQGDPAVFLYLILRGSVTVRYKPYDTPAIDLSQVPAGGAFGWSAVIGGNSYTSGAVARENLQTIRIRGTDLRALVAENPSAGEELLDCLAKIVSSRWKDSNLQVRAILEQAIPRGQRKKKK